MDLEGESPAVIGGVGVGVIVAGGAAIAGTICWMTPRCHDAVVNWTHDRIKDVASIMQSDCHDKEEDDEYCKKVYEECRQECVYIFLEDPGLLPGFGSDLGPRLQRCIIECVAQRGC